MEPDVPDRRKQMVALAAGIGMVVVSAGVAPVALAANGVATELATGADYVVVAKDVASLGAAKAAVVAAGGTVTGEDTELGLLTASAPATDFATKTDASSAVFGVTVDRKVGSAPKVDKVRADGRDGARQHPN